MNTTNVDNISETNSLNDLHSSTNDSQAVPVIELIKVFKHFGMCQYWHQVLTGLNLRVNAGEIYCLVGPVRCGKSTVVNLILGRLLADSGKVRVFGHKPGRSKSGIPGKNVGYMPEHLSVTIEFTIYEAMYYLGLLLGLERDYIHQRVSFLTQLLGLPGPNSYIHHLSCGQRRRVSFALALFQEPNLLILDDPTAMVDPILRYSIWLHLHNIANNENTTVFVTTHNIQEAQNAHKVGLMRDGKIIAQEKPFSLIERFASPNLESVFYTLAVVDGERSSSDDRRSSVAPDLYEASFETIKQSLFRGNQQPAALPGLKDIISKPDLTKVDQTLRRWKYSRRNLRDLMRTSRLWWRDVGFPSIRHMGALFYKDFIRLFRNTGSLLLVLTLPCLLIALSCVTLGNTPQGVSVAVVNLEGPCNTTTSSQPMGCLYIRALRSAGIGPVFFDGKSQGLAALKDGRVCGVIVITDAFSNFNDRNSSERARIFEEIRVTVDYRDVITANFVQLSAIEAYNKFVDDLEVTSSGQRFNLTQIVQLDDPVFDLEETSFVTFLVPGLATSLTHMLSASDMLLLIVSERRSLRWDRDHIAGVTSLEMVVVHTLVHLVVIVAKNVLLLSLLFLILFHLPTPLNLIWTLLILTVQGLCGSAFGLLVACMCQNVLTGLLFLFLSLYISLLFTGSIWTLLGLHRILQSVVWSLPQTEAIKTLRNLLLVGKPVLPVTLALVIPSAWAAVFYCIIGCVLSIWG